MTACGRNRAPAIGAAGPACLILLLLPMAAIAAPGLAAPAAGDGAPARGGFAVAQAGAAPAASSLPGGATALNETYRDWRVACVQEGNAKRCAVSQVQTQQNGQRLLAIEFGAPSGGIVTGTLVLPFGLALDAGVSLQVDDRPPLPPLRFRTCLPVGCLVSVSFDAATLTALRGGTALKLKATADGGAAAPFSIPLQGLATALDRVGVLSR